MALDKRWVQDPGVLTEQIALIDALERHPEQSLHQRRGILHVLSRNIGLMDRKSYDRSKAIADSMEPTRRNIAGLFTLPDQSF